VAELKTKATKASVTKFLNGIKDEQRRKDCKAVAAMMRKATGARPRMWGPSIVGFGSFQYTRRSKERFEWFQCGFSPRAAALTLYLMGGYPKDAETARRLGTFKTGGGCLYIKRLDDVHQPMLRSLIAQSVRRIKAKQIDYLK
jgi:hypothetical protein